MHVMLVVFKNGSQCLIRYHILCIKFSKCTKHVMTQYNILWSAVCTLLSTTESTHRRQKLTLLHLFINLFRKENFPHSSEYLQG